MKLLIILFLGLIIVAHATTTIKFRQFSTSPGLGRAQIPGTSIPSSIDPEHPTYGALQIFISKVRQYTSDVNATEKVEFVIDNWTIAHLYNL